MSDAAREWLPLGAMESGRVRDAVRGAVESWSGKWFAGAQVSAASFDARPGGLPPRAAAWQAHGSAVAIAASAPETMRLAGLALGAEPERLVLSEVDRDIIGRLTATIAADLALAVGKAFGLTPPEAEPPAPVEDPFAGAGGLLFTAIDGADRPLLHCALPRASLVPFCKRAMAASGHARPSLARLTRAIGATDIRIEARLGAAVLPLGDLAALAPGDVLILDRSIEDGAELAVCPPGRPFARGAIDRSGGVYSLTLSPQHRDS